MINKEMINSLTKVFELFNEFNNQNIKGLYDGLNINEIHTIDLIGDEKMINVTKITKSLKITKGGVTKIIKRLLDKEYISVYQLKENKKEKYFKLEKKGLILYERHKRLHKEAIEKDMLIFDNFNEEEKIIISKFLDILKDDLKTKLSLDI